MIEEKIAGQFCSVVAELSIALLCILSNNSSIHARTPTNTASLCSYLGHLGTVHRWKMLLLLLLLGSVTSHAHGHNCLSSTTLTTLTLAQLRTFKSTSVFEATSARTWGSANLFRVDFEAYNAIASVQDPKHAPQMKDTTECPTAVLECTESIATTSMCSSTAPPPPTPDTASLFKTSDDARKAECLDVYSSATSSVHDKSSVRELRLWPQKSEAKGTYELGYLPESMHVEVWSGAGCCFDQEAADDVEHFQCVLFDSSCVDALVSDVKLKPGTPPCDLVAPHPQYPSGNIQWDAI